MPESELRVLFWPVGDEMTASTRHRLLNLLPYLRRNAVRATMIPGGKTTVRAALSALYLAPRVDCVYLQKKLLPWWYLPLLRRTSRRLVYDFDDALYAEASCPQPGQVETASRMRVKLGRMLRAVDLVVAGNEVLAQYARAFNPRVSVVPTTYLSPMISPKRHAAVEPVVLGWIGSRGTLIYLDGLIPVLQTLVARFGDRIVLRVVSNGRFSAPGLEAVVQNMSWTLGEEAQHLLGFDIGVMPLLDDEWSRGKCGFKAIQMMTCGVPVVASPVGVNSALIADGIDGFLANDDATWVRRLSELAESPALRQDIGTRGREKALAHYNPEEWARVLHRALVNVCRPGAA